MLDILSGIGDIGEDVDTYIPINEADLAPKKVCFEGRRRVFLSLKQDMACGHV